jgi:hypothetical protein
MEETMQRCSVILLALILVGLALVLSACSGSDENGFALAPESALPQFARNAPPQVKEAYQFAIANPEVLEAFPCYCGCGNMGHENNLDCYIKQVRADGTIDFENHAFG